MNPNLIDRIPPPFNETPALQFAYRRGRRDRRQKGIEQTIPYPKTLKERLAWLAGYEDESMLLEGNDGKPF